MAQNVLSITQLTEYIRGRLDNDPFWGSGRPGETAIIRSTHLGTTILR